MSAVLFYRGYKLVQEIESANGIVEWFVHYPYWVDDDTHCYTEHRVSFNTLCHAKKFIDEEYSLNNVAMSSLDGFPEPTENF